MSALIGLPVLLVCGAVAVVGAIAMFAIGIYNQIIKLRLNREQAFSDIDVQMKNRYDLVPNLVETVKGYAKHEKELFENVTKARTSAMGAGSVDEKIAADNQFASTLKSLFAVAENYPDLKANDGFVKLQDQLTDIENKIASARRFFNNSTKEYNSLLQAFPAVLFASMLGFTAGEFFDLGEEREQVEKPVEVKF